KQRIRKAHSSSTQKSLNEALRLLCNLNSCSCDRILDLDPTPCHLFEEQLSRHVSFLQNGATLRYCARNQHLQHDYGRECSCSHHRAHVSFGVVMIHQSKRCDASLKMSSEQTAYT